jgi:aldose 1-epimerase
MDKEINEVVGLGSDVHNKKLGIDHNYVLNREEGDSSLSKFASVFHPNGRTLEVFTTAPGVQLYTANYLNGDTIGKGGVQYQRR